jgi:putative ABC transport system permease protein
MIILGESAVIGLVGGILGCVSATLFCAAIAGAAAHGSNFLQILRSLAVTPAMVSLTLIVAVAIATVSAFVPALSAARTSIVNSLGHTG